MIYIVIGGAVIVGAVVFLVLLAIVNAIRMASE